MIEALKKAKKAVISHALIDLIELQEISVVPIEDIKEFTRSQLKHKIQFDKYTIYNAKADGSDVYQEAFIHALGGNRGQEHST